jgi:hypothetical protein
LTPGGRDSFVRDDTVVTRRALETARAAALKALWPVLKWVGVALLVISCALAVYLGAVLLARLVLWAYLP